MASRLPPVDGPSGLPLFLNANHQLRLTQFLPQPDVLPGKAADLNGAAGALGTLRSPGATLAVLGELPPPFCQLGTIDPLPAQELVDLASGSPSLVYLRKNPQLFRVPDDPPRWLDQYLGIPPHAVLIAFGHGRFPP